MDDLLLFSKKFIYLAGVLRTLRDFVEKGTNDQTVILQSRKFKGNVNQGLKIDWNLQFLRIRFG